PPPTPTLFPYTTLFRSGANNANVPETISVDGLEIHQTGTSRQFEMHNFDVSSSVTYNYTILPLKAGRFKIPPQTVRVGNDSLKRSEEHTSELQSLAYLV